jgi:FkbM family methyltransferase
MNQRVAHAIDIARRNPSLFLQRVGSRIKRLAPRQDIEIRDIGGVRFEFDRGLDPLIDRMLEGSYAPEVESALRRSLRPGDTAIDVGANIGYLTAVMLAAVGPTGKVVSFEPVPTYAERLDRLAELNPALDLQIERVALDNVERTTTIDVSDVGNIGWNTMVPGLMKADDRAKPIAVRTVRLDGFLERNELQPSLIKIDVEGFEIPVLEGLSQYWETGARPLIVCEVAPAAYGALGRTIDDLLQLTRNAGYIALDPIDLRTTIDLADITSTTDIVFATREGARR